MQLDLRLAQEPTEHHPGLQAKQQSTIGISRLLYPLFYKTKGLSVELQCFLLIVYVDACEPNSHSDRLSSKRIRG